MIRRGLAASQRASANITAALEACDIWEDLWKQLEEEETEPNDNNNIPPPSNVLQLCQTLYASCLVRVGRDADAIAVYDQLCIAVGNIPTTDHTTMLQWRVSKAKCHQRLLNYKSALREYQMVLHQQQRNTTIPSPPMAAQVSSTAMTGAITCAMRLGNVTVAQESIGQLSKHYSPSYVRTAQKDQTVTCFCLAAAIGYLQDGNRMRAVEQLQRLLAQQPTDTHFLYQWILLVLMQSFTSSGGTGDDGTWTTSTADLPTTLSTINDDDDAQYRFFMELIRINTSPLDDPNLVYLDDKIELHDLLATATNGSSSIPSPSLSFWPEGVVLPRDLPRLKQMVLQEHETDTPPDIDDLWIQKSRAGYGSHGNQILFSSQIMLKKWDHLLSGGDDDEGSLLVQRMVDPLLLLSGYKFSLRIYVVYLTMDQMYISTSGLVKLASQPLFGDPKASTTTTPMDSMDARRHMTNSGREISMQQYGLEYLWEQIGNTAATKLWNGICEVTSTVLLEKYPDGMAGKERRISTEWTERRESLCIPKILGLDFVIRDDKGVLSPYLVEVNRFPGLEPRDELDRRIKFQVVRDAWIEAAALANSDECKKLVVSGLSSFPAETSKSSLRLLRKNTEGH